MEEDLEDVFGVGGRWADEVSVGAWWEKEMNDFRIRFDEKIPKRKNL